MENKGPLLTFHYRDTPNELRPELVEKAKTIIESFGFNAFDATCAIEAKPPVQWNKGKSIYFCEKALIHAHKCLKYKFKKKTIRIRIGRASIYIMRTAFGVDWSERIKIIYAGDDATDEDAMVVCIISIYQFFSSNFK